ncbi:MAG: hypothetical protein A3B34_00075 [Candidatus Sungbacteria bacterium RIFCSPLOWO2_01_FULL_54_21]|uniref:Uncharacterized protein n=1 Tax=Candidatus Sungbacteria bacterium RIFCSPLOWO2_01_FULL_54_21 TaxID=1802279 RepID=A0A1G2L892_9BACT|nr:MAG: hypothetical protein A2679_02400 [Candidatus Sungbacteria bacterium RIFCSPHIGHO2_01_FULL_54_26]OHA06999.1 MAG: hypothetical protein A3B34_00075 [Candidatus Sungbacteria bacterium RIFCSPLOWO2_01_FULL_54_21]
MKHRAKEKASAALCAYYIMQASAGQRGTEQQRALAPSPAHTIQYAICFAHAYDTHTHTHITQRRAPGKATTMRLFWILFLPHSGVAVSRPTFPRDHLF